MCEIVDCCVYCWLLCTIVDCCVYLLNVVYNCWLLCTIADCCVQLLIVVYNYWLLRTIIQENTIQTRYVLVRLHVILCISRWKNCRFGCRLFKLNILWHTLLIYVIMGNFYHLNMCLSSNKKLHHELWVSLFAKCPKQVPAWFSRHESVIHNL